MYIVHKYKHILYYVYTTYYTIQYTCVCAYKQLSKTSLLFDLQLCRYCGYYGCYGYYGYCGYCGYYGYYGYCGYYIDMCAV